VMYVVLSPSFAVIVHASFVAKLLVLIMAAIVISSA
jgi:hypothetical protein